MAARFLTLMNPHRRRRRSRRRLYGAAAAAHARKLGRRTHRRRRARHNPPVRARRARRASRPSPPKMTPAMRAKISRAVKAANRRRASSRGVSIFRRRSSAPARRIFRRRSGGGGFSAGSLMGSFRRALSKDLIFKAGGAVVASIGTGMVLQRWGNSLPGANSKWGRVAYSVAIPIGAAFIVGKRNRAIAEGMVIGGLVMGINAIISQVRATTGTVSAYPQVSDFSVAGELGPATFSYYPTAGNRNLIGTPMTGAFSPSAW